jgi:hypothetical protein
MYKKASRELKIDLMREVRVRAKKGDSAFSNVFLTSDWWMMAVDRGGERDDGGWRKTTRRQDVSEMEKGYA